MSSDLCKFDESLFLHTIPAMGPSGSDVNLWYNQEEADFYDSYVLDQFISDLVPSYEIENLSVLWNELGDFSGFGDQSFFDPRSSENVTKAMERSDSSNYFVRENSGFCSQTQFDSIGESPNFQNQDLRMVCSTEDLRNSRAIHVTENSFVEESISDSKIGRYSAEEKKQRILKYRMKRNKRNFNQKIKYVCRKTLADNRPRVRGRFARSHVARETPEASSCSTRDKEDDFLVHGFLGIETEQSYEASSMGLEVVGQFMNRYGQQTQLQYYCGL